MRTRTLIWMLGALAALGPLTPTPGQAASSLGGIMAHSPDDISGFSSLTGDNNTVSVSLPFTFTVEGTNYTTIVLSTNGWIEFGANTSGNSDETNDCLPTSAHTNPLLAAYWDDLAPFGTNIRYGTVGTSPNRVFIADYEVDLVSGVEGQDDLRFQVQLHERSNVITVRYRDSQNQANGQAATIGFQGAGGASSSAQPIACNGKVLDDNRPDEGWSVDVGRAGNLVLSAVNMHSPDDLSGFTTLTGNDNTANVTMPFSVTIEGIAYSLITLSTNGWIEFGGNTSGNSDPTNDCLPSSAHTNPLLAAYWDDMNPFGTAIRYGTVGASPNRIFIVDYEMDVNTGEGSDDTRMQVQIHETSGLINVRYRDSEHQANGQLATIGFQGAGGASAAAYPIVCDGKILDDNQNDRDGWSVHPKLLGAMSLHGVLASSPDDLTGFTSLSGNDSTASVTLPFSFAIDGTNYSTVVVSTNGWLEFGANTSGGADSANQCLPTSNHTNPFLAAYWDDLTTFGNNVRYGTVGSSPNRVWIADFQAETVSGGNDIRIQVQLHERSNVITVKYPATQAGANGQAATIGFQGAGGASAAANPLVCNGKILDDNRPGEGWSIAPLPICGNGAVETKESCDQGGSNGAGTSCCTSVCGFRASGQTCRTGSGDSCDPNETCTGSAGTCPSDVVTASGTSCRAVAGVCDVAETCTGTAGQACPANGFVASGTTCRAGSGDLCDPTETCTGSAAACPADVVASSGTSCRASAGVCDVAETCTGTAGQACPVNGFVAAGTTCRVGSGDLCDPTETCTGSGAACPADVVASSGTSCRASAGVCDVAETCTGTAGQACPADVLVSAGTTCRTGSGDLCDPDEACSGSAAACPADVVSAGGTTCRTGSGDLCDPAETCPGSAGQACPADVVASSGTLCRADDGVCDVAETCTGNAGAACPADGFVSAGTTCRTGSGDLCDPDESCTGNSAACPADVVAPATTECRGAAGVCDVAETCTGSAGQTCPADVLVSTGTTCRTGSGDLCDPDESCTGNSTACPADVVASSSTTCRGAAGVCDVAETCSGSAGQACPADGFASSGTTCRPGSGDLCDPTETCTGSGAACPADVVASSSTTCRGVAGVCDVAETCSGGAGQACPADGFASSGTTCRTGSGDLCDPTETCTGSGAACPADVVTASGTTCRPGSGDLCDPSETCTGTAGQACPSDVVASTGTTCRGSAGICDVAETCSGSAGQACPADGFASPGTTCRAGSGDACDPTETCSGSSAACPADVVTASGTTCRPGSGDACDPSETCTGTAGQACPTDVVASASTTCRAAVGTCDVAETCSGTAGQTCPTDGFASSGTTCRPGSGDSCDPAETCNGNSGACPADVVTASGTTCRAGSGDLCDPAETCTGTAGQACPTDAVASAGTSCRAAAGDCDVAETCTGSAGAACPSDGVSGGTVECRASAGPCDVAEHCDGSTVACPTDGFEPSTHECRAAAGDCDEAESCTGASAGCPTDAKSTSVCRASAGVCDVAESCDGVSDDCPADAFEPATTVCRAEASVCDIAETCTGTGALCPVDVLSDDDDQDGVCDSIDLCPDVADPSQSDGDFDGQGDACDACTNLLPSFADRHKVIASRLDGPAGTHKLKASGRCTPFLETPPPDPEANGIRLVLENNSGDTPLDVLIPGGAYDPFTRAGWRVHTFPQGMTASYKNSDAGFANGIRTVKFVWKIGQGITKFTVVGKNGTYPIAPGDQPVKFTLVLDTPVATTGQCCEAYFLASPHPDDLQPDGNTHTTGDCAFKGGNKTLTCRWKAQHLP